MQESLYALNKESQFGTESMGLKSKYYMPQAQVDLLSMIKMIQVNNKEYLAL